LQLPERKQRLVESLQLDEQAREIAPGLRRGGIELDRLVEGLQRVFMPSLVIQQPAEARQILRPCMLPDRARQPFQREVVLRGLRRQKSEQMHRIGMLRINRKGLLAAKLRVERSARLEMTAAGRAKRRGAIGLAGRRRGLSCRSLAIAIVHGAGSRKRCPQHI
jgi:hypothetical protein